MIWTAFILGLLGSLHCIGMCGPIAFMLPLDHHTPNKKYLQLSLYHFGRLLSYASLGIIFGLLGKSFYLFGMQQQLSIAVGVLMILAIVLPQNIWNKLGVTKPIYKVLQKVKSSMGSAFKKRTYDTFLTIGFLNGFLPCGLVYIAIFAAIAAPSLATSTLYMAAFGLGTIPLMTATALFGKYVNQRFKFKLYKLVPVFVFLLGTLFILRGLGLGIPFISPEPVIETASATINCH